MGLTPSITRGNSGAVLYGDVKDGPFYFELIQSGADVGGMRHQLLFGEALCVQAA